MWHRGGEVVTQQWLVVVMIAAGWFVAIRMEEEGG